MSDERPERCDRCRWWRRYSGGRLGECRRHPPRWNPLWLALSPGAENAADDGRFRGGWPQTLPVEWCGEFRPKETP